MVLEKLESAEFWHDMNKLLDITFELSLAEITLRSTWETFGEGLDEASQEISTDNLSKQSTGETKLFTWRCDDITRFPSPIGLEGAGVGLPNCKEQPHFLEWFGPWRS